MLFHTTSEMHVLERLRGRATGLSADEATERLHTHGLNTLPRKKPAGSVTILLRQTKSPLMGILLLAAVASVFVGDLVDAFFIVGAALVNVTVGFLQEYKANHALEELQNFFVQTCRVRRAGEAQEIETMQVVPGDVVLLGLGDRVPADARLLRAEHLEADEAPLTGESLPVAKATGALSLETPLAERTNMLYAGTLIVAGRAEVVVTATGKDTEIGRIAKMVGEAREPETPLQRELRQLGRFLSVLFLSLSVLIFFVGWASGTTVSDMFFLAVALAVAAIPEGLLVAVTVVLAVGMRRMLGRKALVRRLIATETLGSVSVICADKTGTITEAKMRASVLMTQEGPAEVSALSQAGMSHARRKMIEVGMICNDATSPELGSPTETALLLLGKDLGYKVDDLRQRHHRADEIPFDSARKYMVVLTENMEGSHEVLVKGAVEHVLGMCSRTLGVGGVEMLSPEQREQFLHKAGEQTRRGLRVLGIAFMPADGEKSLDSLTLDQCVFVGWIALHDPVRATAADTIARARAAGVRTVMITGDHPETAETIAKEIRLAAVPRVLVGTEVDRMTDRELAEHIISVDVFARVLPEHKVRIVRAWQTNGGVVAMTGDGVNDAPALAAADVGVALGTGSQVAKEAADMVLLDNNLETIVAAIEEGRTMFENIRKIVSFLLLTSWTEMILVILSIFTKLPAPLLAAPILYINLLTDSAPALALTIDPAEARVMEESPRPRRTPIVDVQMRGLVFGLGLVLSAIPFILYAILLSFGTEVSSARSVIFVLVSLQTLALAFPLRRSRTTLWQDGFFTNRLLNLSFLIGVALTAVAFLPVFFPVFGFVLPVPVHLAWIGGIIIAELALVECYKWGMRVFRRPLTKPLAV